MDVCVTLFLEIKAEKKAVHDLSVFDKSNENILWIKIGEKK